MDFKYKSVSEVAALTPEQAQFYSEQKRAFETEGTKKMIADAIKERFPEKDAATIQAEADAAKLAADEFKALKEDVKIIKENMSGGESKTDTTAKQIEENKETLKLMAKKGAPGKEITIKADTLRASVATSVNTLVIDGIGQIQRIKRAFYDVCRKITVSKGNHAGTIAYTDWDESTTVANAAAVAEGVAFNESTAKFKGYTLPLQKIGDTLPVSEEFFEDYEMAAGELRTFIETNVSTKVDYELINGDNTGSHLKGALASIPVFDATPVAGSVVDPNIYDLIVKMFSKITSTGGNKYNPSFAAMNRNSIDLLVLKKDLNNNYQFPPQHPIFNLIVEDNNIADDVMFVGDGRYARIYEMGGVVLSQGVTDTQFAEDLMTLKARTRLAFLIRTVDQTGFLRSAGITADLAELKAV